MDITKLIRKNILDLTPYSSARDEFEFEAEIYLDANENPFDNGLNRYPDPYQLAVKERLGLIKGVDPTHILIGNGSDEVLDLIYRAFCEPGMDNVVSHNPSYGMYPVLAEINNIEIRKVNLGPGFQLDGDQMINAADQNTKVFFICSPNNPSGNLLNKPEIKKILDSEKGLVVIDEAYIDFADADSWISELHKYPNLIVCQTLSKAWGLAGLRIGICFASTQIIKVLNAIKPPYNVNALSQKEALRVLVNEVAFRSNLSVLLNEKNKLKQALADIQCIDKIYPSDANFLLVRVTDSQSLYDFLMQRQIIVRNRSREYGCENCLRLTVGTPKENERLLEGIMAYDRQGNLKRELK